MRAVSLLIALAALLCLPVAPLQAQPVSQPEGNHIANHLPDPFYPELPFDTVKIRYRISGRFVGQEMLAAKAGDRGTLKVRESRYTDTALGLERPIHLWILETPEMVVQLDLVNGRKEVYPNLRKYLSLAWKALSVEQKSNLAENLPSVGTIIGRDLKVGVAVANEGGFLGLPGIKVALGPGRTWYWSKTDLVIKSLGHQGGFSWGKEAIDIIQDQELDDSLFQLPVGDDGADRLEISAEDREWAGMIAERIIALLARPLLGRDGSVLSVKDEQISYRLPIPWPFPAPPGYRTVLARYRLDPNWAPYPKPPDMRPWPPLGLGISILKYELQEISALLSERMPLLKSPEDPPQDVERGHPRPAK